jgi:histidine ammonia-lyase
MGNASALKCLQVVANAERALAIELLAGAQGIEFLAPLEPGVGARAAHRFVRSLSPTVLEDRPLGGDIESLAAAVRNGDFVAAVEHEVGALA